MFGPLLSSHLREGRRSRRSSSGEDEGEDEDDEDEDEDQTAAAEQQRSSKPAHRGREEEEAEEREEAGAEEHERGFRRDTKHTRNFVFLLLLSFFLSYVVWLLLMCTQRHMQNPWLVRTICTKYVHILPCSVLVTYTIIPDDTAHILPQIMWSNQQ